MRWLASLVVFLTLSLSAAAEEKTGGIGINPSGIHDWSTQQPFLNVFKTAREWIGHLPNQWGGATEADLWAADYLDPDGWPVAMPPELSSIGTVILTDLPPEAVDTAGRYRLRFEGDGIVEVLGRATNVKYGKGEVTFDFEPGPGPVDIRIQRTDRTGTGNYVRNITVVKTEHEDAFQAGEIFNPLLLEKLEGFSALRFMGWMNTNNSAVTGRETASRLSYYTWTLRGAPVEVMLELANTLQSDPWFTLPHLASDEYIKDFATLVRDGLDPNLKAYVEYSNEVWNWQFSQAAYADAQAQARWNATDSWLQYYTARSAEIGEIWRDVFGAAADDRLVRVISSQTGWLGLEEQVFDAPLWRAEDPTRGEPAEYFDAYAITGYVSAKLGTDEKVETVLGWLDESAQFAAEDADAMDLSGHEKDAYIEKHRFDLAVEYAWDELLDGLVTNDAGDTLADYLTRVLPYHVDVAKRHGLELVMYEGGTHVVGIGPHVDNERLTEFFIHLNYSPEMGLLYEELISGWQQSGAGIFMQFTDVANPTKWGSWGALRTLSDSNPRWDAIERAK